jgi:hypothetical protein
MLKKERRTQQFQQTPRYPYVEPLLPPLPTADAYQLPEQASENSKSTSESTIDDPEEHKRLPGKGDD